MLKFNKQGVNRFKYYLRKFLKNKRNKKLNWEHAINYFCSNEKLNFFRTRNKNWIEVDDKKDYKKALKIFN